MGRHPTEIDYYTGPLRGLAPRVANARYDEFFEFLGLLGECVENDSITDLGRGRPKLAKELSQTSIHLKKAATHMKRAWEISEPHMRGEYSKK